MRKRRLWRALLAGAMIGLVEAAGLDRGRRVRRRPLRIVRLDDRDPADLLPGTDVWFLDPIGDPRPAPGDLRRPGWRRLRLAPIHPRRLLDVLRSRAS